MCRYCRLKPEILDVFEANDGNRIFVTMAGSYLHIYDEDFPGFSRKIPIRHCPKCGRDLALTYGRAKGGVRRGEIGKYAKIGSPAMEKDAAGKAGLAPKRQPRKGASGGKGGSRYGDG